jgi:hypothetical protein
LGAVTIGAALVVIGVGARVARRLPPAREGQRPKRNRSPSPIETPRSSRQSRKD